MTDHAYLTVPEAAAVLRISRSLCYGLVRAGIIPSHRLGRLIRIRREEHDVAG